jgi:hypothetical protein
MEDAPLTEAVLLRALGEHSKQFTQALSENNREVLEQLGGVNRRLDRVNGRLDRHDDGIADLRERTATLEARRAEPEPRVEERPVLSVPVPDRNLVGRVVGWLVAIGMAVYQGFKMTKGSGQ